MFSRFRDKSVLTSYSLSVPPLEFSQISHRDPVPLRGTNALGDRVGRNMEVAPPTCLMLWLLTKKPHRVMMWLSFIRNNWAFKGLVLQEPLSDAS